jgi:hypothetical protein
MFATAPKRHAPLEAFELSLSVFSQSTAQFPEPLNKYLMEVIRQAKSLYTANISYSVVRLMPEAIALAQHMQKREHLARNIDSIETTGSISPEIASQVLKDLENNASY